MPWETICKVLMSPCVWAFPQESTVISDGDFVSYVPEWRKAGAQLIGGCCRTTPAPSEPSSRLCMKIVLRAISRILPP